MVRQSTAEVRVYFGLGAKDLLGLTVLRPRKLFALFSMRSLRRALRDVCILDEANLRIVAIRGALVPQSHLRRFSEFGLTQELLPVLEAGGIERIVWRHPEAIVDCFSGGRDGISLAAIFSRLPEPGLLDFEDLGVYWTREGTPCPVLDRSPSSSEITSAVDHGDRAGCHGLIVIDAGGDADGLASELIESRRLAAWFSKASRNVPERVAKEAIPVYRWFEPEDFDAGGYPAGGSVSAGVAFVPIGAPGEDATTAATRILGCRRLGYSAIVPRFFTPLPGTREWGSLWGGASRTGLRLIDDPEAPLLALPKGLNRDAATGLLNLLAAGNRWPSPPLGGSVRPVPTGLREVGRSLDQYLRLAAQRVPRSHARDLIAELVPSFAGGPGDLSPCGNYPFFSLGGRRADELVEEAIRSRLLALDEVTPPLAETIRHAVLCSAKRLRPILLLAICLPRHVDLGDVMPAALALEWIHTASLLQDDLPCMDDDAVRRRQVTAHRAYGEGPALLASDALLVMAFQDLLGLARHSTVGYERAVRMCMETCDVVGLAGLVDGQARDLTLRSEPRVSLQRILDVHRRKTAPLFGLAASLGGILCNMSQHETDELRTTLLSMGLAFQIVDDVLDATGTETFGRGPGSDRRNRLPTFGSVMNAAEGRRTARGLLEPILQAPKSSFLAPELLRLASFVLDRER